MPTSVNKSEDNKPNTRPSIAAITKSRKGNNTLCYTPQNFLQEINIKFPSQQLPVCANCKRNYKTRDVCRIKNGHTAVPWTTAYICVTIDKSCIGDGEDVTYAANQQFAAKTIKQAYPYCVKSEFVDPKTPCCTECKSVNRTRAFCRETHKHKEVPWNTVFVVLSADARGVTEVTDEQEGGDKSGSSGEVEKQGSASTTQKDNNGDDANKNTKNGDDINVIDHSRTFLSMISTKQNAIQWLEAGTVKNGKSFAAVKTTPQNHQQSAAATWQANYHQYRMKEMLVSMQTPVAHVATPNSNPTSPKAGKKRKRAPKTKEAARQDKWEGTTPANKTMMFQEEAMAAISHARVQAAAEENAQIMRQQFTNCQMYMQQMMHMQMQQYQQGMYPIQCRQQQPQPQKNQPVSEKIDKQSQPLKKRGRKKKVGDLKEVATNYKSDYVGLTGVEAKEAEKLPLVDNPEEDGELFDFLDSSFDVKKNELA